MAEAPQYIPPPKELVMRDMESLIHHFIIYTQGIKPPKAETYCGTEAPKGELGFFIVSDGSARPYRLKIPRLHLYTWAPLTIWREAT